VGLTCGSVGVLKGAVTIAIRYSAGRQQFGPPDSPEVSEQGGLLLLWETLPGPWLALWAVVSLRCRQDL
jgi:hypothetical protein